MGYARTLFILVAAAMLLMPHATAQQATITVVIEGPAEGTTDPTPEPEPLPVHYVDEIDAPAPEPMEPASNRDPNTRTILAVVILAGLLLGAAIPVPRPKRP